MKGEYTFVTLDNDMVTTGDAVFVDIDNTANVEMDFVHIDDSYDMTETNSADFITMDDMNIIGGMDIDAYSSDISEVDVSIIL